MSSHTQFQIQQLRALNQQRLLEAIVVLFTAIFVTALLPSLLLEYLYADQVLTEAPPLLKYLPVVVFSIGILYDVYVFATNMSRSNKIKQLENSMMMSETSMDVSTDDEELKELEALVDQAIADQTKKTKTTRSAKRGTSKRKSQKK
ncbi:MAG: hypothetical protein QG639_1068 [Patescibacteria group bacterium]|jgi:hypothetical protein|nr:hypothetical protein [Patescibacteria group bacterium]